MRDARLAADGRLYVLYRSATEVVHRDIYLLATTPAEAKDAKDAKGAAVTSQKVGPMESGVCVMSTAGLAPGPRGVVAAWERQGRIEFGRVDPKTGRAETPRPVPGKAAGRKHPAAATDAAGRTLVAWSEGTGWNKGGAVAWQVFDADGEPVEGTAGRAQGLPAWSGPAVFVGGDSRFVLIY